MAELGQIRSLLRNAASIIIDQLGAEAKVFIEWIRQWQVLAYIANLTLDT